MSEELRKLWKNESDWFSAPTVEEATRIRNALYGWSEDLEPFELEPLEDDRQLTVTFQDGFYEEGAECTYPPWVDKEPLASIKWLEQHIARVSAPAKVWAANTVGLVASTEY